MLQLFPGRSFACPTPPQTEQTSVEQRFIVPASTDPKRSWRAESGSVSSGSYYDTSEKTDDLMGRLTA
jgi:hypothetical protein